MSACHRQREGEGRGDVKETHLDEGLGMGLGWLLLS